MILFGCAERPREPRDPTPGYPHFTIETYNVKSDNAGDEATLDAVGIPSADIVCLQETTAEWVPLLEKKYADRYPYRMYSPDEKSTWLAVLSRFPVEDGGFHAGPNSWHPAWHFRVQTAAGWIQILNLQLRNGIDGHGSAVNSYLTASSDHAYEINYFDSQCDPNLPTIVLGDFNEGPDGGGVKLLESQGFTDVLWLYHPGQFTWRYKSVANEFTQTLDHIMYDPKFEPLDAWAMLIGNSDHIPVIAHFEPHYPW